MLQDDITKLVDKHGYALVLGALAILASENARLLIPSQPSKQNRALAALSQSIAKVACWCDRELPY